jgi:cytoskeletal protein CcmA (bactofilin family)
LAIFGKPEGASGPPAPPDKAAGAPPAATVIGPNARFVGEISGDEDIVIHGQFEGNIDIPRRVTVAQPGQLKGDIHARTVVVGGRVNGQIRADERAELLASATVQGNVNAPKVVIAEGARLQGNVAMTGEASPRTPEPSRSEGS